MKHVHVLDNTLRDGSYAVDFSFTAADTSAICTGLEQVGVRWIEVGHGAGLGATRRGFFPAAASDEEYLRAAQTALTTSRFGMFCNPAIASLDDIDLAADHGMGFIRVGIDVTGVAETRRYIERARGRGLLTTTNLMKSYAVPPAQFAEAAALAESYGAEVVYLVDSAGCMFPEDVRAYLEALRERSQVRFGFHGHDNLGMAVYNSLFAADLGASFVDGSLQGLGRRPGNAATELLAAGLDKRGYDTGVDVLRLLGVGEEYTRHLLGPAGIERLDVVSGYAGFHSNFLPKVQAAAEEYDVDPARLIIELCEIDRCSVRDDDLRRIASRLREAVAVPSLAR
jgi:4-hydroxy 2-oxovalerate aldolase/long-chain acyl-CoA synthetase